MRIRFEHLPFHVMFAQSHVTVNKEMWRVGRSCGHGERVRAVFVPYHVAVVGKKQHENSTKLQVDLPSGDLRCWSVSIWSAGCGQYVNQHFNNEQLFFT